MQYLIFKVSLVVMHQELRNFLKRKFNNRNYDCFTYSSVKIDLV